MPTEIKGNASAMAAVLPEGGSDIYTAIKQ